MAWRGCRHLPGQTGTGPGRPLLKEQLEQAGRRQPVGQRGGLLVRARRKLGHLYPRPARRRPTDQPLPCPAALRPFGCHNRSTLCDAGRRPYRRMLARTREIQVALRERLPVSLRARRARSRLPTDGTMAKVLPHLLRSTLSAADEDVPCAKYAV
jgi:hypothetical protein